MTNQLQTLNLQLIKTQNLEAQISAKIIANLWQQAKVARKNAYAPYSKFLVGAAIFDENGNIHNGANVENAAYPQGTCAEATAIGKMITYGSHKIRVILICAESQQQNFVTPCGGCRQKIAEFADINTAIIFSNLDEIFGYQTLHAMLPFSFSAKDL